MKHTSGVGLVAVALACAHAPAWADVKAGVDAWEQGDYAKALKEWRPLADAGDADAQFNIAQAYKLGRGVPQDINAAMDYYRKAAMQGHAPAEDQYGLLLYQQGRQAEAMPYLEHSAARGDSRAQYLLGIALFNGDLAPRNWVRAYAMMTRASAAGVSQATTALEHMDKYIPEAQRKDGLAMAAAMETPRSAVPPRGASAAAQTPIRPPLSLTPLRTTPVAPSKPVPPPPALAKPAPSVTPTTKPTTPKPVATTAPSAGGGWRVQLGAFSEPARAETQWKVLAAKVPAMGGIKHSTEAAGAMTRLLAGPFKSRADADALCVSVKAGGGACIVKAP